MNKTLVQFAPVAQAVALLLHPHAEVVLHDLASGCIAAIYNNLSKRKPGDESLLEDVDDLMVLPDVFPRYFKTNWDGRRMKSVTATIKDLKGKPQGLFCINLDLSKWVEMQQFILTFVQNLSGESLPEVLFKDDWREKINSYVTDYLKRECQTLKSLTSTQKKALVCALREDGAFQAKNAAAYIADVLGLSRATVYNYLRCS